jgi:putative ABC transport system permease protein
MESFLADMTRGIRTLLKSPLSTTIALLTIGLGIGVNSSIYSVVDAVLLRPLNFAVSDRLVVVLETNLGKGFPKFSVSPHNFVDWTNRNQSFEQIGAYDQRPGRLGFNVTDPAHPEWVPGAVVSTNLFDLLEVRPILGRTFDRDEGERGRDKVVVVGEGLWKRRFAGEPGVIGKAIPLNGEAYTVIGVIPSGKEYPEEAEVWLPSNFDLSYQENSWFRDLRVVGRLKPGVTLRAGSADMQGVAAQLERDYSQDNGWGVRLVPLQEEIVGDIRPSLQMLVWAVGFVLLIACANVANLLLAKAASRRNEIGIRMALGASRSRVVRQLLTESVVLALMGGVLGVLLAMEITHLLVTVSPDSIPRWKEISVDSRVLSFTLVISVLTGILFGLSPALNATKVELGQLFNERARSSDGSGHARIRSLLVVVEVALALMLLFGGGLIVESFSRLRNTSPGFDQDNLLTMRMLVPQGKYEVAQLDQFDERLLTELGRLPGVEAVGFVNALPLSGTGLTYGFFIEDAAPLPPGEFLPAQYRVVNPDYFRALRIPFKAGRGFTDLDDEKGPRVLIINESLARRYFPNEDPIGHRLKLLGPYGPAEIVGVVGDVKHFNLEGDIIDEIYAPYLQDNGSAMMFIAIRSALSPTALSPAVLGAIKSLDDRQPVYELKTMDKAISDSIAPRRLSTTLLSAFAAIALSLALGGIVSVMGYTVAQRTREIGIRSALGATSTDIVKLVLGSVMKLVSVGIVGGIAGSLLLSRALSSLLFGIGSKDPLTLLGASLLLLVAGVAASLVPAWRATRVDPVATLRSG